MNGPRVAPGRSLQLGTRSVGLNRRRVALVRRSRAAIALSLTVALVACGQSGQEQHSPSALTHAQTLTMTLVASADTYLRQGSPNQNQGTETIVQVRDSGNNRALVRFDQAEIAAGIGSGTLVSATLELTISHNGNNWGSSGRTVEAHRLAAEWTELGATWNCPNDTDTSNQQPNCNSQWQGGTFIAAATASVLHTNGMSGVVQYDVTSDVLAFLTGTSNYGWLLKKTNEGASGLVDYTSREGAAAQAPRLVLVCQMNATATPTATLTSTRSPTPTPSSTPTATPTDTPTPPPTATATAMVQPSDTPTPTPTDTPTPSPTATVEPSDTPTPIFSPTATDTPTGTPVETPTATPCLEDLPPSIQVTSPTTATYTDPTVPNPVPDIVVEYAACRGVDLSTLQVRLDNTDLTAACVSGPTSALCPMPVLFSGLHTIRAQLSDLAGTVASATSTFTVVINDGDNFPPTVAITSPAAGALLNSATVPVTGTVTDDGTIGVVFVNSQNVDSTSGTFATSVLLQEGLNVITANATDVSGKEGSASVSVTLDTTPPRLTILAPTQNQQTSQRTIVVLGEADDANGVAGVEVNDISVPVSDGRFEQLIALQDGSNVIQITGIDGAGNVSTVSTAVLRVPDPPQLTITSPTDAASVAVDKVTVTGTTSHAVVALTVNGAPAVVSDGVFTAADIALSDGENTLQATATDSNGDIGTATVTITRVAAPPMVTITSPADLGLVTTSTVEITGTVSDPAVAVVVNGQAAVVSGTTFTATNVPLVEGGTIITAAATDAHGRVGTATITVIHDQTAPRVSIDSPRDGATLGQSPITVSGMVNDIVLGTVNDGQATVTVNGTTARVANRTFVAEGITLAPGDNSIAATATDASGNHAQASITVHLQEPTGGGVHVVSGDNQSGPIASQLASALVVQLSDAFGRPVAGRTVVFRVTENNGTLAADQATSVSPNGSALAVISDTQGRAQAQWTVGTHAGAGNNRVEVSALGFTGSVPFTASGQPTAAAHISLDAGGGQFGVAGEPVPRPFVAIVTDAGHNRLANVPVTFTVVRGGGYFAQGDTRAPSALITTDSDGRALARVTLGPEEGVENNVVEANFPGNAGLPATFVASGRIAGDPATTRISGVVLDNTDIPVEGAFVWISGTTLSTQTDAKGQFVIEPAPVGSIRFVVDGSTAQRPGTWPHLAYDLVTIAGQNNTIGMPIHLLPLDIPHGLQVDETHGGTLTLPDVPGFSLTVQPGSATFPDGSHSGLVSVTVVHADKTPMTPNFGQQPRFIVTIQPTGTLFDPPAAIAIPNVDGLAPREITEMYSFDHDLGQFVSIGLGTVSEDGTVLRSNAGVGVLKGGWHCGGNPASTGSCCNCTGCSTCVNGQCVLPPCPPCTVRQGCSCVPMQCGQCEQCSGGQCVPADGRSCDDGRFCTSADGQFPGPDVCMSGACAVGKAIEDRVTSGSQVQFDIGNFVDFINRTAHALEVSGCRSDPFTINLNLEGENFERCCEDRQQVLPGTRVSGSVEAAFTGVECFIPALSVNILGAAEVGVFAGISFSGTAGIHGETYSPCTGECDSSIDGQFAGSMHGGLQLKTTLDPDLLHIGGGIRGGASLAVLSTCQATSGQACAGPITVFAEVMFLSFLKEDVSVEIPNTHVCTS